MRLEGSLGRNGESEQEMKACKYSTVVPTQTIIKISWRACKTQKGLEFLTQQG